MAHTPTHATGMPWTEMERRIAAYDGLVAALRQIVEQDESFGGNHQYAAIARAALAKV